MNLDVNRIKLTDVALLGIASFFAPLGVLAANPAEIVHPERLLLIGVVGLCVGLGAAWISIKAGMARSSAVYTAFVVVVLLMTGGALVRYFDEPIVGWLSLLLIGAVATWLIPRLEGTVILTAAIWGIAGALLAGVALSLVESMSDPGADVVQDPPHEQMRLNDKPDILLVVLDGYPGLVASEQDGLPYRNVTTEMRELGYTVPESAWTPYWTTRLALPAILDMGYPVISGYQGRATDRALYDVIAGDNLFTDVLVDNGYTTYVTESGWTGSSCGPQVDVCVESAFADEAVYWVVRDTVFGPLFGDFGAPWTNNALATMEWLYGRAGEISASDTPEFVFAHVVAPHPPFYLDRECRLDTSAERAGQGFQLLEVSPSERHEYLVDQLECVDSFIVELASEIEPDDVVVFVADHGTDRRLQASSELVDWERETIVERMNVFVAANLPSGCSLGEEVITSNLLRRVLQCLSDDRIDLNQPRIWVNPMEELDQEVVSDLMGTAATAR